MQIRALVNPGVVWAEADEPLVDLARRMCDHRIGSLPVRDNGRLAGIVTERDVVAAFAAGVAAATPARAWMTTDPAVATPAEECAEAAYRMLELGVRHLLVVEEDSVVGVVSARDLLMIEAWPGGTPPVAPMATS